MSEAERVEEDASDRDCNDTSDYRDHSSDCAFVDWPVMDRVCAFLQAVGSAKQSLLVVERLE